MVSSKQNAHFQKNQFKRCDAYALDNKGMIVGYDKDMSQQALLEKAPDLRIFGLTPILGSFEETGRHYWAFDKSILTQEERINYEVLGVSPFMRYKETIKLVNEKRVKRGKPELLEHSLRNRLAKLSPEKKVEIGIYQPGGRRGSVIFRRNLFAQSPYSS